MPKSLLPLLALLLGSGFLFFAGGINGLLLPIKGADEGFSTLTLGFLGTGWSVGYILGCLKVPKLVAKVGHVRSFSVMAAVASLSILLSALIIYPIAWIILRALAGFAFAGAAMIVEGWLTDKTEVKSRGSVFGIYTMVNLFASTLGQLSLAFSETIGIGFFIFGAVFYSLAILPTAISASSAPAQINRAELDMKALWRNSPIALVAILFVGISNGAFGTLGAVYAKDIGLNLTYIALFMSAPILTGALFQIPVGYLSDRMDRRIVLVGLGIIAIASDLLFIFLLSIDPMLLLVKSALLGAAIFAMHPIIIAHANDHAEEGTGLQVSGGLLLIYGVGSIVGPLVAGVGMTLIGPSGLFAMMLVSHVVIVLYTLLRLSKREAVAQEDKGAFVVTIPVRGSTPQTTVLSGQSVENEDETDTKK
ncbi:MAG: MFS transporter [Nitratireductor sp.]